MTQEHSISFAHVERLLGEYGIYQHAKLLEPRLSEGYCVDDNARAVTTLLRAMPFLAGEDADIAERTLFLSWKFLVDAKRPDGSMHNFRTVKGVWLTHDVSGDMYARVLRACVAVIVHGSDTARTQEARVLMGDILRQADHLFIVPRACAEVLVAFQELSLHRPLSSEMNRIVRQCAAQLIHAWQRASSQSWPWFEDTMTYANALLPHGLLASLVLNPSEEAERVVRQSSFFLLSTTIKNNMFVPIGNSSWYHRDGKPSQYDQQPIEAAATTDFLIDLRAWDPSLISSSDVLLLHEWFFGNNTARLAMASESTGACYDGLLDGEVNQNCGAESLLAYLWVEVRIREARLV